jgi:hypothetical protein
LSAVSQLILRIRRRTLHDVRLEKRLIPSFMIVRIGSLTIDSMCPNRSLIKKFPEPDVS